MPFHETLHTSFVQVDSDLQDERGQLEIARTQNEELERSLRAASENLVEATDTTERLHATLEGAEIVQNFLVGTVTDLVNEVGDLEEDLEEAEEELDDMKESADEALAGWAQADALSETTLAWGTRVVDLLERAEREGRR